MNLSKLLDNVTVRKMFQTLYGRMVVTHEVEVSAVRYDSRTVQRGDMFVALRGTGSDGHGYAAQAIGQGAKVIVIEDDRALDDSFCMHNGVVKVVVPDTRVALAKMSATFFGHPAAKMTLVGVTGTNGKTTTASLIHGLLTRKTGRAGLIGTIEYKLGDRTETATHTTPGPVELHRYLSEMVESDCLAAVMEVSSHALDQRRVEGLDFHTAVFTNLTGEHQDYHGDMESYFDAKKTLFTGLQPDGWAVINVDDGWGKRLVPSSGGRILTYAIEADADLKATNLSMTTAGTTFRLSYAGDTVEIGTRLVGKFNVMNILATAGAGITLGIPLPEISGVIQKAPQVHGRFEPILSPRGWTAIIDYAHTPDALEKALRAVREAFPAGERKRIITVFGCGGDRDRKKRPEMGRIAASLGDVTIVTSDNPRTEDPGAIIDGIMKGLDAGSETVREPDRTKAIETALGMAEKGDIILIAGKGHEDYQVIGEKRLPFSDRAVVQRHIQNTV